MMEKRSELHDTLQRDPTYRKLVKQHRSYENRLEKLCKKHFMSETERVESINIKKKKLVLKDRMEQIARKYRSTAN